MEDTVVTQYSASNFSPPTKRLAEKSENYTVSLLVVICTVHIKLKRFFLQYQICPGFDFLQIKMRHFFWII